MSQTLPYLSALHAPVTKELTAERLTVTGEVPRELSGVFARNSGNPQFEPTGRYHWFDGDGMIHALRFDEGRVDYRNRWVRTAAFEREHEAGRALWAGLLEPLDPSLRPPIKDTANTDLTWHNGKLLATWWLSGTPVAVDPKTLETLGPCTFDGRLPRQGFAAHPKVCPRTGELMAFGYSMLRRPYYAYGVVSPTGELTHTVELDLEHPRVPHDIAITERFTILLDLPLGYDAQALKAGKRRIAFDRDAPARIGVIPRHGTADQVLWFEVPPCYVYHTINAHEDGDVIVLTACRIADPIPEHDDDDPTIARLDTIHLTPQLWQWRLDPASNTVSEWLMDERATEFPRAHDGYQTRPLRYSYNPTVAPQSDLSFDGILKYDLTDGSAIEHRYPDGWFGGEVLFAPRPGAAAEDDGWVLSVLTHPDEGSRLVVLDAQDLAAQPLANVALPHRIPLGFHAEWAAGV